MCFAEKCCYVIPANVGCILVGIFSFILSMIMLTLSIAFFIIEGQKTEELSFKTTHFAKNFGLNVNVSSVHMILSIVVVVALLWMLFSVLLVIGILQNRANFVLSHFSFGIIITILCQLSALLLLLQNCWVLALVLFISSLFHIHVLVVVHTVYELMSTGKDFRFNHHEDDQDLLAECFDTDLTGV